MGGENRREESGENRRVGRRGGKVWGEKEGKGEEKRREGEGRRGGKGMEEGRGEEGVAVTIIQEVILMKILIQHYDCPKGLTRAHSI